ncbi:hypothetical protein GW796_07710 [archaeon]|nr:hypothetical protein [archaeon]
MIAYMLFSLPIYLFYANGHGYAFLSSDIWFGFFIALILSFGFEFIITWIRKISTKIYLKSSNITPQNTVIFSRIIFIGVSIVMSVALLDIFVKYLR